MSPGAEVALNFELSLCSKFVKLMHSDPSIATFHSLSYHGFLSSELKHVLCVNIASTCILLAWRAVKVRAKNSLSLKSHLIGTL